VWRAPGTVVLRLAYRSPIQPAGSSDSRCARSARVEEGDSGITADALTAERLRCRRGEQRFGCSRLPALRARLDDVRDLTAALPAAPAVGSDADPVAVVQALGSDHRFWAVGHRDARSPDQAMSTAVSLHCGSTRPTGQRAGAVRSQVALPQSMAKLARHVRSLTCLFPSAAAIAALSPKQLPMPASRRELFSARVRARVRERWSSMPAPTGTPSPSGWPP